MPGENRKRRDFTQAGRSFFEDGVVGGAFVQEADGTVRRVGSLKSRGFRKAANAQQKAYMAKKGLAPKEVLPPLDR